MEMQAHKERRKQHKRNKTSILLPVPERGPQRLEELAARLPTISFDCRQRNKITQVLLR